MGRSLNRVELIGNLGADPDARMTAGGSPVTNLNIATDESYKDKNTGQIVPKTEWHRVVCYNRLAEIARDYTKKGSKVWVEGRLQTKKWQDQSGQDRYTTEIVIHDLIMLDSKQSGQGGYQQGGGQQAAPQQSAAPQQQGGAPQIPGQPEDPFDNKDEDIPFR